ncbi:MAG TPA: DUF6152 family protein [Vicinamibacterales bacterium]|nr:DUF6152 family protein [Vicinamibacterales bacterium]
MRYQPFRIGGAIALLLLLSSTLDAHHSFSAQYDSSKPVEMRGTVTKVEWTNPHARVYIDVRDDKGQTANWNFEMASPNILVRNGWKQNTVKIGDQITVSGYLARRGDHMAIAGAVADATGKPIFDSNPDIAR